MFQQFGLKADHLRAIFAEFVVLNKSPCEYRPLLDGEIKTYQTLPFGLSSFHQNTVLIKTSNMS